MGEKTIHDVSNPFALVIGMGTMVLILSTLGFIGAMCAKRYDPSM